MSEKKYGVILDSVNRMILGVVKQSNAESITIENPAILNMTVSNGKPALQVIPVFPREFLANPNTKTSITYRNFSMTDIADLRSGIISHYEAMFADVEVVENQPQTGEIK